MSEHDSDLTLLQGVGRGEPSAMRMLVAAKLPRVFGLAMRTLRNSAEAEEVAQEAMIRAWRQASTWRPGQARFDTWLHTVVLNLCRDRLRRRRDVTNDGVPEVADPALGAEAGMLEAERGRAVAKEVAALPERQREAILLVHYQDLSGTEAAAALDVSVEALESLLARGRRTLRARLGTPQERDTDD